MTARPSQSLIRAAAFAIIAFGVGVCSPAYADQADPAPRETAEDPSVEAAMGRAFGELADSDAGVREAARATLLATPRRYLPALQKLVEANRPLLPSQAAALRQIVTHIYLAGEPYPADHTFGFLGVRMQSTTVSQQLPIPADAGAVEEARLPQIGVVIVERLLGFVGSRMFLDGDVILAIAEKPELQFGTGQAFSLAVRDTPPGRTIHFHVLRRGRLVKIPVVLDPRPEAAEQMDLTAMEALDRQRREKAETYWRQTFGPLVSEEVG